MCRTHRAMFASLVVALYDEGKFDKAEKAIDYCLKVIPMNTVPGNYHNVQMAGIYYRLGKPKKAFAVLKHCADMCIENLEWAYSLNPQQYQSANSLVSSNLYTLQEIVTILNQFDKAHLQPYMNAFQKHVQPYQQFSAMRNAARNNQ